MVFRLLGLINTFNSNSQSIRYLTQNFGIIMRWLSLVWQFPINPKNIMCSNWTHFLTTRFGSVSYHAFSLTFFSFFLCLSISDNMIAVAWHVWISFTDGNWIWSVKMPSHSMFASTLGSNMHHKQQVQLFSKSLKHFSHSFFLPWSYQIRILSMKDKSSGQNEER